jgi:hypothetical protein
VTNQAFGYYLTTVPGWVASSGLFSLVKSLIPSETSGLVNPKGNISLKKQPNGVKSGEIKNYKIILTHPTAQ